MASDSTPDIRIVLVEPSHPGNIGAVARAMMNMDLQQLVLVRPQEFPHPEASARAAGADSILAGARVVASLEEAIVNCGFIAATTARARDQNFRVLEVREAAVRVLAEARRGPVALLFGAERTGLENEHLEGSHVLVRIPASPDYAALNLAMAVQLVAYEIFRARHDHGNAVEKPADPELVPLATPPQMQHLYGHLEQVLDEVNFKDRTRAGTHLMMRIRRFLQRAELDQNEANILRGILTAIQGRRRIAGSAHAPQLVYLDNAATTPVDPAVSAQMREYLGEEGWFANPSATAHAAGRAAAQRIEMARGQVARLIGALPAQIIFTSGATEADNLAVLGTARALAPGKRHVISSRTEHKAVLDAVRQLTREGFSITWLQPDTDGRVSAQAVAAALRPDTALVSLMHVNNETGVIQDIRSIGEVCRAQAVLFHVDAAQSVGRVPLNVADLPVDLLSLSAHKIYGPKGVGALYLRAGPKATLTPLLFGGGQESGLRPGTLPTHQIAGFGLACELAGAGLVAEGKRITQWRDRLWGRLESLGDVTINGAGAPRVPHILNIAFDGVEGESLVSALPHLAVSTGAACNSALGEPSYVLRALGRSSRQAESSLRFSFGRFTTDADIEAAAAQVRRSVLRLREVSPAGPDAVTEAPLAVQGETLGPAVRELFSRLQGAGALAESAGTVLRGEAGHQAAEAWIRLNLLVSADTVIEARFQALGCPHTLATASWLVMQLAGRRRSEAQPGSPRVWAQALEVPVEKLGRLLLIEDALHAALQQWP
jgi:cysteine desulfurase